MKIGFCIAAFIIGCLFAVLIRSTKQDAPAENVSVTTPTRLAAEQDTDNADPMLLQIVKHPFGIYKDQPVSRYVCSNENGLSFEVIDWGASLVAVKTADRTGRFDNVILNCERLEDYQACEAYLGATIGRYSDRIANGSFSIDDKPYSLSLNDGKHHLNGGSKGFDKQIWTTEEIEDADAVGVRMSLSSLDGDQGYPGNCSVSVTYLLNNNDQLSIQFEARSDAATQINLANQIFWNLNGDATDSVATHQLRIDSDKRLVLDDQKIATGKIQSVADTRFDFRQLTSVGQFDLLSSSPVSITVPLTIDDSFRGYKDNFVLNSQAGTLAYAATLISPKSGRELEVWTTQPGLHLDSANLLDGQPASGGLQKHAGISLRTQRHPNSPDQPESSSTLLAPGETYNQTTVYSFSIAE